MVIGDKASKAADLVTCPVPPWAIEGVPVVRNPLASVRTTLEAVRAASLLTAIAAALAMSALTIEADRLSLA